MLNTNDSVLLIIDIQEKLVNAAFNKESLLKKSEIMAKASQILNIPVIITEQYPHGLGETAEEIKNYVKPLIFEKTAFNALDDSEIEASINKFNKKNVIVLGIETHICVYQTTSALLDKGYQVTVIKDACSSRSEEEHIMGIHNMEKMGASIKTTEMVLFELLKSSKHPDFKQIQALIK